MRGLTPENVSLDCCQLTCRFRIFVSTLAQSGTTPAVSAPPPTGTGYVSESVISGQSPYRAVIVRDVTPVGPRRFVGLKVTRS